MDDMNNDIIDKEYKSYKIPDRRLAQEGGASNIEPQTEYGRQMSLSDGLFYEIEYDNSPIPGAGKFVLKAQKIVAPETDEIRELFYRMRDIARQYPLPYSNSSRFYDRRVQQVNSRTFYRQAVFMKDFEDDYKEQASFSSYFPYYQMMGYEQLRTYFSWRTNVRRGLVNSTSLSYVYLYIYELLNNIGVDNPKEGLDRLMSFWTSFKIHDSSIDKYLIRWLKDYHIYYNLPQTFRDFVKEHDLTKHYPNMADDQNSFELFCSISKYDIRKSTYFTEGNSKHVIDCFYYVIKRIRQEFENANIRFDDAIFHPTKKLVSWTPFKGALFYNWLKQSDRRVVYSDSEIYICNHNEWMFSTVITTDRGRQFIGYVMKQMESVLREITKYKYKITANIDMMNQDTVSKLQRSGIFIENLVKAATIEFYREATKTVVTVDQASLDRIRQEAYSTQEALIVEEQKEATYLSQLPVKQSPEDSNIFSDNIIEKLADNSSPLSSNYTIDYLAEHSIDHVAKHTDKHFMEHSDIWNGLRQALSEMELQALAVVLQSDNSIYTSIKEFADHSNIMLEVLVDKINDKAMDYIGDSILDEDINIYEDYEEQVKGMVEEDDE